MNTTYYGRKRYNTEKKTIDIGQKSWVYFMNGILNFTELDRLIKK